MYYTDEMRLQDFTKAKDLYYQFQSRLNISYSMNMILVLLAKPSCPGYAKPSQEAVWALCMSDICRTQFP